MTAVIQRVREASVTVAGEVTGRIDAGLIVYLGVERGDTDNDLKYIVRKVLNVRIFPDEAGKMNLNVTEIGGAVLVVSQFTLCADTNKGNRPSFNRAAEPQFAEEYYRRAIEEFAREVRTGSGIFGAYMQVASLNDGPVTIILQSR
jgi:D-aminoacyl-tRNA deacylase